MYPRPSPQLGYFFQLNVANTFNLMSKGVIFQKLHATSGDIIQFIPFVRALYAFKFFLFYNHRNCENDFTIIPFAMGTHQGDPLGGPLFVLTHFRALSSIVNHFPSCLFPSIVDDTHIISPPLVVSFAYGHFQTKFRAIVLSIQPHKCVAWSPSGLTPNFNTPSQFTTPTKGIKVLGVPLGTITFTSSFIKKTLQKYARHVDLLLRMGDVQVAFVILTPCFMQRLSYILQCTLPSSTFIKSLISFDFSLHKMFGFFWVQNPLIAMKYF